MPKFVSKHIDCKSVVFWDMEVLVQCVFYLTSSAQSQRLKTEALSQIPP
jgi:hypothetical protein